MRTPPLTPPSARSLAATALTVLPAALIVLASLSGCDAASPTPDGPPPLDPLPSDAQALVVSAFQDVEALFDLGVGADAARTAGSACCGGDSGPIPDPARLGPEKGPVVPDPVSLAQDRPWRDWLAQFVGGDSAPEPDGSEESGPDPDNRRSATANPHRSSARLAPDTTLYTGVFDAGNAKGYLAVLSYREPQGVGVWSARLQHARALDHDDDAGTADVDAVETLDLTFLTHADLAAFLTSAEGGANAYLVGTSDDAEAAFTSPQIDVWRVSQVYSPAEGGAVVTYANAELRETVTVRDPIITLNADGTGTVRDGGADGKVRTRYYGADFSVSGDGSFSGTLLRTLTSHGDTADGALVSRTDYAIDGTYMQTRQRGGDGVVIRENSEG
ncbi:hypothetical protein [Rubrivirga marina]|uniref:Lipoprotein n=1 Tax=Rubrivirga marina TaxID=1196024 RepID=A0A271ISL9_9BACT|nr:hypothetical protein [Rubrivirga marina]PAP74221.1 hypothetical protein BSZ37_21405 [Rubrivirga marina]